MMKHLALLFFSLIAISTQAQLIPNFDIGLKAGTNLTSLRGDDRLNSSNRAGQLAGIWARAGAMGLFIQPELYYTSKVLDFSGPNNQSGTVKFNSLDLPILIGGKLGLAGIGGRLNTGPVVSFLLDDRQTFSGAMGSISKFQFKNQNLAWQIGAGVDIRKISFDLRYEHGLSSVSRQGYSDTKLRLYNVSLGYKLF